MRSKPMMWTAGALTVAALAGVITVYSYNVNRRHSPQAAQRSISDLPLDAQQPQEEDYRYILRTSNGRLAVYLKDATEPQMVFDVSVRVLPEFDQQQLEEGIRIKDYQTLVTLIEDYVS